MAKFIFINIPSRSHINPTLPLVQELVARGDEVIYYLTDSYKQLVEATRVMPAGIQVVARRACLLPGKCFWTADPRLAPTTTISHARASTSPKK